MGREYITEIPVFGDRFLLQAAELKIFSNRKTVALAFGARGPGFDLRSRVAVKLNFRPYIRYIRRYTSPNEKFEYSYPLIKCSDKSTS